MNIAILGTTEKNAATKSIFDAGKKRGHNMSFLNVNEVSMLISNSDSGYDRIYKESKEGATRQIMSGIDAIIPRLGSNVNYATKVVEHLNKNMGIYSTQSSTGIGNAANKFTTLQLCSQANIKTPKTVYANNTNDVEFYIQQLGGLPFIVKLIYGSLGAGVNLMETSLTARTIIQTLHKQKQVFILQEYIEGNKQDYRAVVIGDRVIAAYKRKAGKKDFRANMSLNGIGTPVTLSKREELFCINAAKAIGLHIAGVDFMKDATGTPYLIEINANFGFKIEQVTGVNVGQAIIQDIEENAKSKQKQQQASTSKELRSMQEALFNERNKTKLLCDNERIKSLYQKYKNNSIQYTDTNGRISTTKIRTMNDLLSIMSNTFNLQEK